MQMVQPPSLLSSETIGDKNLNLFLLVAPILLRTIAGSPFILLVLPQIHYISYLQQPPVLEASYSLFKPRTWKFPINFLMKVSYCLCPSSRCGLCDTYYIAHVKNACAFLGDGMSKIEVGFFLLFFVYNLRLRGGALTCFY